MHMYSEENRWVDTADRYVHNSTLFLRIPRGSRIVHCSLLHSLFSTQHTTPHICCARSGSPHNVLHSPSIICPGQSIQSGHRKFSIHGLPCLCSVRSLLSLSDSVTSLPTRSTLLRKTGVLSHVAPTFWMSLQTVWVALLFRPMQFGSGPTVFMWVRATSLFHPWGRGLPSSSCSLVCCHHRGCGNLFKEISYVILCDRLVIPSALCFLLVHRLFLDSS